MKIQEKIKYQKARYHEKSNKLEYQEKEVPR